MKASEALLRALASAGGEVPATQFDEWVGQLIKAKLVKRKSKDDSNVYYIELTDMAKEFLKKKGVDVVD